MNQLFFCNLAKGTLLFNRFKLLKCLSASTFGGVYLCSVIDNELELIVLKVLSSHAAKNSSTEAAFRREMDLACRVNHPNVVQAKNFFQDDEFTAFTMDYIGGGTLADRMANSSPLELDAILKILLQLGSGLQAIHNRGIIHRDLKPENILVDVHDNVKIVDFGISVGDDQQEQHCTDHLVGTMDYLSPEYVAWGEFDNRSDIYALGVIAYRLITGQLPFQEGSILVFLTRPEFPLKLSEIVLKAVARQVEKRYQHVAEFLRDLSLMSIYSETRKYQQEESILRQSMADKYARLWN
jgi:serine/threonine protein kinase